MPADTPVQQGTVDPAWLEPGGFIPVTPGAVAALASECVNLRALVKRLTDVADALASESSDPGTEALAAIHCGRHLIYG